MIRLRPFAAFAAFLLCIPLANWTLEQFGIWWGLVPSGTLWAGLTFTLRDAIHEQLGRWWVVLAIAVGTFISALIVADDLAAASGVAFLLGELADLAVYEPLRQRNRLRAVRLSGFVGSIVDSAVFLWLAPFPLSAKLLAGTVLAKLLVVELTVRAWRRAPALG